MDSSLLVSLASKISSKRISTYNVSYNDNKSKISQNAQLISNKYNTEHHELVVENLMYMILEILEKFGEPVNDSSTIPTYCIYDKIKVHARLLLVAMVAMKYLEDIIIFKIF